MNLTYFFIAATIGFVVMATITAQALESYFTIPAHIRHACQEDSNFRAAVATRRAYQVTGLLMIASAILCGVISYFLSGSLLYGYWFGFLVALPASYQRFQSKNPENYEKFCQSYADCFSTFTPITEQAPTADTQDHQDDQATDSDDSDDTDDDCVSVNSPQ